MGETDIHLHTCTLGVPEQALGWLLLGLRLVVEDKPSELSCRYSYMVIYDLHVHCTLLLTHTVHVYKAENSRLPDKHMLELHVITPNYSLT